MNNILLIGIGGVHNFGCEAIIRGTVEILKHYYPDINITYASYNYNYDIRKLSDLKIRIIDRTRSKKRWSIKNITKKILSLLNRTNRYDNPQFVKDFDALFSIGGDMYTLAQDGSFNYSLPLFIEKCLKINPNLKYILWGASVGPFTGNKEAESFYKKHLKKADLIVAREKNTIDYLNTIGINTNVVFGPDPAFFVPNIFLKKVKTNVDRFEIGINLSPLSASYKYGSRDKGIDAQLKTIKTLIQEFNANITLIPHVLASYLEDDDMRYLKSIKDKIPNNLKSYVTIIEEDNGFIGRKNILANLDCVIAARMHCAINAITCGVPTIFLSYSDKAKGMAKFVYGDQSMICGLEQFENTTEIIDMIKNRKVPTIMNQIPKFEYRNVLNRVFNI